MEFDVNWLSVLIATVVHQVIGALWYGVVFRDTWLRAMGTTREEVGAAGGPDATMAFGAVSSLISVVALALIMGLIDAPGLLDGVVIGAIAGIGFVAASTFMNGLYEQRKPLLTALFGAYQTVGLMAAGAIIGAF